MGAATIRRFLGAAALVAGFGLAAAAPATAQEEPEGEPEISHSAEECIHLLEEGGEIDDCQKAPNQLVPETNEVIWGGIGFFIVFGFLAWKGVPAIKSTMAARTERIRGDLEGAEAAKAEAQTVLDEYRAQLADAKAEAGRIIEEARQAA
ncbi:MAG TPA: ATP synthase F0 subunit B, partial [Acidimicrobiales bacterium]|nr:ATP synthase F0 subunit B [Acidimicrobiales bacterium]